MISLSAIVSERVRTQFNRMVQQTDYQQAYWYAISADFLAKDTIKRSYRSSSTVNQSQAWAAPEIEYDLHPGSVSGHITDKQACFNINTLTSSVDRSRSSPPFLADVFKRIVEMADLTRTVEAQIATLEYLDRSRAVNSPQEIGDSYSKSRLPSSVVPMLMEASEIYAIQGISRQTIPRLMNLVCALPASYWRLNVNTITSEQWPLLSALFYPYIGESTARDILDNRPYSGWTSVDEFFLVDSISHIDKSLLKKVHKYLDVNSNFFELDALVKVHKLQVRMQSLIYSEDRRDIRTVRFRLGEIHA